MSLLTKEDYLKLGIERLAELNVEKDKLLYKQDTPYIPYVPYISYVPYTPYYEITTSPLCYEEGGVCTNPQMDCVNCPKKSTGIHIKTNSGSGDYQQSFTDSINSKE